MALEGHQESSGARAGRARAEVQVPEHAGTWGYHKDFGFDLGKTGAIGGFEAEQGHDLTYIQLDPSGCCSWRGGAGARGETTPKECRVLGPARQVGAAEPADSGCL